jgi:hypothetical protein
MEYQFGVEETDKHDGEVAGYEANSLEEAKEMFASDHPEDVEHITCITSDNGYEEIR